MSLFNNLTPQASPVLSITKITPETSNLLTDALDKGASIQVIPPGAKGIIVRTNVSPELYSAITAVSVALQDVGGISSQDSAAEANRILKQAKTLIKSVESERKALDGPLNEQKSENKSLEDRLVGELQKLVEVVNGNITKFQVEEEAKARKAQYDLEQKRKAELEAQQKERDRVAKIKDNLLAFERNVLAAINSANIDDIDDKIDKLSKVKLTGEYYMEYLAEALELHQKLVGNMALRKAELMKLENLRKQNAEQAEALRLQQEAAAKIEADKLAERKRQAEEDKFNQELADTANIQMAHELKTSLVSGAKGVAKRWTFDEETIDLSLLPEEFKTYDKAKITAAIAAGRYEIPGVDIHQKIINVSR